uniref:WD repeat domain 75 n=1 Tax=Fundulus heteroclitus TaxID=8078 RepID=A0A3Q2QJD5_FUNHE
MVEEAEIRVVRQGGSKITFREPVISSDSRFLLCASGHTVKVFSTVTEECVQELRGHTDLVTGVLLRPSNHLQVYSCSADGTVRLWDFTDGILIRTYVIGYPIFSIFASASHDGVVFIVTASQRDNRSDAFQLVAVHLPACADQLVETTELSAVLGDVSANPAAIAFGRAGEYLASANGSQLEVYFFKKKKSHRFSLKEENRNGGRNTLTCVACHPTDDCVATGHEDGKIRLWRNFSHRKEYTYSTLHWHHGAVASLRFTPEGSNLLSGGLESVLVQWRYEQESQRNFLPRLGAAITHIAVSPDGSRFCTSHSDNKITIIQSCVKVSSIIQGLVTGDEVQTDLMVDPRSKALVLNGKPGHLQFYSLQRDKLLFNLDIVQQEFIHQSGLDQYQVVRVAFDGSGSWLATVEERKQKAAEVEVNLKLWAFDDHTQSFVLNTTIAAPHEARISALCFDPAAGSRTAVLVSSSADGHFKAWRLAAPPAHTDDEGASWSCDFVGAYHGLVPGCCSFSADGSLLAVSFQEVVTVWSPASWELLATLSQPPGDVRNLCFGRLSCSKYLLGTTTKLLCCWNLLTCSLEWSTSMEVSLLLADPLSENMAAFCHQDGSADRTSERSAFLQRRSCDPLMVPLSAALSDGRCVASRRRPDALVIDDAVAMTPFYLLLGKHQRSGAEAPAGGPSSGTPALPQSSAAVRELLQTPAHVLPAASFLCSAFLESLLISVTDDRSVEETGPADQEMESEKEEEEGSDEETGAGGTRPEEAPSGGAQTEGAAPGLTRTQVRELRRVRKLDHSWLAHLLDS